ncbi:MAG: hypothetical protein MUF06_06845 [Pirellulaceae bacterium]|jgi:hypothetical protein|nr:hypothetical protein [Pirellulaceae bacterium]
MAAERREQGADESGEGLAARDEWNWPAGRGRSRGTKRGADRQAAVVEETGSTRGAGCSGPEQPTLRKVRRSPASRFDSDERLIRDAMIYHDVRIEGKSQRFLARIWRLTPGRVSQIVKDMRQRAAEMPGGDWAIDQFVQRVRDRSRRSRTEQTV